MLREGGLKGFCTTEGTYAVRESASWTLRDVVEVDNETAGYLGITTENEPR